MVSNNNCGSNDNFSNTDQAEWLRISDILDDWCKANKTSRKNTELAIVDACENNEIKYSSSDSATFYDTVIELHRKGLLIIDKRSFYNWKSKFELSEQTCITSTKNSSQSLSDFLTSIDSEYISINDLVNIIHKKIGLDKNISDAYQVLHLAIGRSENKPHIYKKDNFKGWEKGTLTHPYQHSFRAKKFVLDSEKLMTLKNALKISQDKRFDDDDLPF